MFAASKSAKVTTAEVVVTNNDPQINYVTTLLNGDGTNGATNGGSSASTVASFASDASTNNFAVAVNGDIKPNRFNPNQTGYYGVYFTGGTNQLSVGVNAAFSYGTGDFTWEMWFNAPTSPNGLYLLDHGSGNNGTLSFANTHLGYYNPTTGISSTLYTVGFGSSFIPTPGVWYHIAAVRVSGITYLYLNGKLTTSAADTHNYTGIGCLVAQYGAGGLGFNGYISNVRIVKGTGIYTGNFTPSTTPLTAITGTSLLTCQSPYFRDNGPYALTLGGYSGANISYSQPFTPSTATANYGSAYFNGSTDYLAIADSPAFTVGASSFTLECWVYLTNTNQQVFIGTFDASGSAASPSYTLGLSNTGAPRIGVGYGGTIYYATASSTIPTNQWIHVAGVRDAAGYVYVYVNGVQSPSLWMSDFALTDSSQIIAIGRNGAYNGEYVAGYISNVRLVNGTAVYTANFTPPTAPLTAITNTQLLTLQYNGAGNDSGFVDSSPNNLTVTRYGNATQGSQAPFGANWSVNFNRGRLSTTLTNNAPGTGSFTYELFFNISLQDAAVANSASLFNTRGGGTGADGFDVTINSSGAIVMTTSGTVLFTSSSSLVTQGLWYHLAIVRNGTTNWTIYLNGSSIGTISNSTNFTSTDLYLAVVQAADQDWFKGYISNFRYTRSAVYTTAFTPSTTPLVPLTATAFLSCNSYLYADSSANNYTVTPANLNGGPSIQRLSPFSYATQTPQSYSTYFNGSTDYFTTPSSNVFAFGTGDFTVEAWVNIPALPSGYSVLGGTFYTGSSDAYWFFAINSSGYPLISGRFTTPITGTTAVPINTWAHIAISRASGTNMVFVNGVLSGTSTTSIDFSGVNTMTVGTAGNAGTFTGYISNFRIVKGTAVYTANFTPSTTPLTAISGTSLLTCQDATIKDNSTNVLSLTATGSPTPRIVNPFGYTTSTLKTYDPSIFGGSMYFDGSGDYLQLPTSNSSLLVGTASFTIEFWLYKTVAGFSTVASFGGGGGNLRIFCNDSEMQFWIGAYQLLISTKPVALRSWNHIVLQRNGTTASWYINGVLSGTTTVADNFNAGTLTVGTEGGGIPITGYISGLRIVKGTAVYNGNFVPPTAPVTAITGTQLLLNGTNAGIYDSSMQNIFETVGNAQISTVQKKYGTGSLYFDGTGDYLVTPAGPQFNFGTGDFTIECWFNTAVGSNNGIFQISDTAGGFKTSYGNSLSMSLLSGKLNTYGIAGTGATSTGASYANSTWVHLAVVRSSSVTKIYANGILDTTFGTSGAITDTTNYSGTYLAIGGYYSTGYLWNGYIDDFRITKGYARYTANFTPPTAALPTS